MGLHLGIIAAASCAVYRRLLVGCVATAAPHRRAAVPTPSAQQQAPCRAEASGGCSGGAAVPCASVLLLILWGWCALALLASPVEYQQYDDEKNYDELLPQLADWTAAASVSWAVRDGAAVAAAAAAAVGMAGMARRLAQLCGVMLVLWCRQAWCSESTNRCRCCSRCCGTG